MELDRNDALDLAPLAEINSNASLEDLNATLAENRIDAAQIVSIVQEPAHYDPVGILVKPTYRVLYRP